jgi:hypothetical protein
MSVFYYCDFFYRFVRHFTYVFFTDFRVSTSKSEVNKTLNQNTKKKKKIPVPVAPSSQTPPTPQLHGTVHKVPNQFLSQIQLSLLNSHCP